MEVSPLEQEDVHVRAFDIYFIFALQMYNRSHNQKRLNFQMYKFEGA